ncbi:MAG: family 20 glycosylhydrolase, partial [Clostridia bacterium]|nr:family 20 glycosylhydrolase [Clostridia bacterium]
MKVFKRSLAVILALCMMLGVVPFTAFASENTSAYSTGSTEFMRVFHLDCGRKYFTVDQIKELIDAISAAHYTHMELAIGNDGLRFLLDDMSVTANGNTYASETVKSGVQSGNAAYAHSGEWSQDEMDTIIAYADSKNIEIIPLVNTPGHMDAILAAAKACGIDGYYKTSARTVDLENEKAVAFTQALVMKYAKYFKDKGCKYFNIGADEYANDYHEDASTGMGFGYLIDTSKKYGNFITYVNTLVGEICKLGMTPVAFNDGIYFRENTSYGTFDNRLVVAAWTGGYS